MAWKVFDETLPVLTYEYSFGPGTANALAVGIDGGIAVVSPPLHPQAELFDELARYGPVKALFASNAFHYMGMPEWKARFPEAALFAPAQSITRVQRKSGLAPVLPLSEAAKIAGSKVDFVDMPHYKTGEVLVKMNTLRGRAWYVTDIVMNIPVLPRNLIVKSIFRVTKSGPGLCFNNFAPLFMVADKSALKRWLYAESQRDPPRYLIPAHGPVVDCPAGNDKVSRLFQ